MKQKDGGLTGLMGLLVCTLFALCLLGTLLAGASSYQRMVEKGEARFGEHTAVRYLATRIRQAEHVQIGDFEETQALMFSEDIGGREYVTRVYWYEGYLWELFSDASARLRPQDGEKLMEAEGLELSMEGSLIRATTGGKTVLLYIRDGRQVGP